MADWGTNVKKRSVVNETPKNVQIDDTFWFRSGCTWVQRNNYQPAFESKYVTCRRINFQSISTINDNRGNVRSQHAATQGEER